MAITVSDQHILQTIFNPFLPLTENPDQNDQEMDTVTENVIDCNTTEVEEATELELLGIEYAEKGKIEQSLQQFSEAIKVAPSRASGYNNRAQALRLKGDHAAAMDDLEEAIRLSCRTGKVARQAYCQRAVMNHVEGRLAEAQADYKMAAKLGSEFATAMSMQLNPYAALCNQMLGEVMAKLTNTEIAE